MRITLLRNATLLVEGAGQRLVVDPSLGPPGRRPPLSLIRSRPRLNPTVPLRAGIDARPVPSDRSVSLFGGELAAVPTLHGRGPVGRLMGPGVGFVLRLPGEPSLYLSGDTVLTDEVRAALERERPDVAVMHAGGAQLDVGSPILMTLEEQLEFVRLAPGRAIAVHLEALDHCGITRAELAEALTAAGLSDRVDVPADGQTIVASG